MAQSESVKSAADLVADFRAVRDDDNAVALGGGVKSDEGEYDGLAGAGRSDCQDASVLRECRADVGNERLLISSQFDRGTYSNRE